MSMIGTVMQAITGGGNPKAADVSRAMAEVDARIGEAEARAAAIDPDSYPVPTARREVLDHGSVDDVEALDSEHRRLRAELAQLRHRRGELHTAHREAVAREALANTGRLHKALADAVSEAERQASALELAQQQVQVARQRIAQARQACEAVGMSSDPLAVDRSLSERVAPHVLTEPTRNPGEARGRLIRELSGIK